MIPVILTVGPLATADADNISVSQSTAGAAALTITGDLATAGIATMDVPRRVLITSAADDRPITFRLTGTNGDGNAIREVVPGTNGASAYTTQDFLTVTEIFTSGATAGNVTAGTNGIASSPWKLTNSQHQGVTEISWFGEVTGTITWGIQYSYGNPNNNQNQIGSSALGNYPTPITAINLPQLTAQTVNADAAIDNPIQCWRAIVTAGTGSVQVTAIEGGMTESGG